MLFSQDKVAEFINKSFEPAWQSVRPVPIVRIDFGNGTVLTRTLNGNILTSVCTPDGLVVDALPGIYKQDVYLTRLEELRDEANKRQALPEKDRAAASRDYHRRQVDYYNSLARIEQMTAQLLYVTKSGIEMPVKKVIASQPPPQATPRPTNVGEWNELAQDTHLNETSRRLQIQRLLAEAGPSRPEKVTRPIYKDVLHADLDDPYLGLGEVLTASYPFAREDAAP